MQIGRLVWSTTVDEKPISVEIVTYFIWIWNSDPRLGFVANNNIVEYKLVLFFAINTGARLQVLGVVPEYVKIANDAMLLEYGRGILLQGANTR